MRKGFVEVVGYVDCGVQADYIHGAEGGGLSSADHWASKFVHFRNAKAHLLNGVHARNDGINSNAVGDKGRCILTKNSFFAQVPVSIGHQKVNQFRFGFWTRDDLQ